MRLLAALLTGLGGILAVSAGPPCSLHGRVLDVVSSAPLAEVTVIAQPTAVTAVTDADGWFCFPAAPEAARALEIIVDGYRQQIVELPALADGSPLTVQLVPLFQEEVVVTGTRTERQLADSPVRVEVVNREAIEKTASRTLADAIEFTPGVRVENNCQNCNFSQLRLLGLNGAYSQVLIDSQPMMSSLAAVSGIEHIPTRFIERLEVVKGGGSALYGPGAVGGVVNVIPHEAERSGGGLEARAFWIDGDPGHTFDAGWDWISPGKNSSLALFGQLDEVPAGDTTGDGFTEVSRRELAAFGLRFNQFFADRDAKLVIDASRVNEDRRGGNRLDVPPDQADVAEAIESQRTSLNVSYWRRHGNGFDYRLTAAFAGTDRDTYYGAGRDPNAYGLTENVLAVLDSQFNHHGEKGTWTWGLQYTSDHLEDSQPAYDRFLDDTYANVGAYMQNEWRVSRRWELVSGVRVDDFSELDDPVVSPRIAAKVAIAPEARLRASVASGFRGPQVFDEDLHITVVGGQGSVIRNAPGLEEESSLSAALGVEWLPVLGSALARFEVNAFHTRIRDIFLVEETDDPETEYQLEFTRTNGGGARVYGMELNAGYALGQRLSLDAGFVAQQAQYDTPEPDFGSTEFFRTPDYYGSATLTWEPRGVARFFVGALYTGEMKVPHYAGYIDDDRLESTPAFLTFDLSVSRRFTVGRDGNASGIEVMLGCKNLMNEFQGDLDQGPDRDSGYVYGPRFPRRYHVSARYDF